MFFLRASKAEKQNLANYVINPDGCDNFDWYRNCAEVHVSLCRFMKSYSKYDPIFAFKVKTNQLSKVTLDIVKYRYD